MMIASFATDSIVRLRAGETSDSHGNSFPDWGGAVEELTITGCSVQPGATVEMLENREGTRIDLTVYAPANADVRSSDRVRYDGEVFEVDGRPQRWKSPTGTLSHTVILLTLWEG